MILRIIVFLLFAGITYLSVSPTTNVTVGDDKVGHFIAYFTLMFFLGLELGIRNRQLLKAWGITFAYGIIMELIQHYVPGRFMSLLDLVANSLGGILAFFVLYFFGNRILTQLKHRKII